MIRKVDEEQTVAAGASGYIAKAIANALITRST
jgi:hypothetical protein